MFDKVDVHRGTEKDAGSGGRYYLPNQASLYVLGNLQQRTQIFGLIWSDLRYGDGLKAVRSMLKGGKIRYVPLTPELATELRKYPAVIGEERLFPAKRGARGQRRRVEHSFEAILTPAGIQEFRFPDLRHTFASWYMMNGRDLYELAKILGHSNIRMTERYAKLGKKHIARTGDTAREMWKLMSAMNGEREPAAV